MERNGSLTLQIQCKYSINPIQYSWYGMYGWKAGVLSHPGTCTWHRSAQVPLRVIPLSLSLTARRPNQRRNAFTTLLGRRTVPKVTPLAPRAAVQHDRDVSRLRREREAGRAVAQRAARLEAVVAVARGASPLEVARAEQIGPPVRAIVVDDGRGLVGLRLAAGAQLHRRGDVEGPRQRLRRAAGGAAI
eukprot:5277349-Prymnesium_polylepis.1